MWFPDSSSTLWLLSPLRGANVFGKRWRSTLIPCPPALINSLFLVSGQELLKVKKAFILAGAVLSASLAHAAPENVDDLAITQIILDGVNYGGCMVKVSPLLPSSTGCGRRDFVSFDCKGEVRNTKAHGKSMLETAQLAFLTDQVVRIRVDNDYTVNQSFCTADYIRLDKSS